MSQYFTTIIANFTDTPNTEVQILELWKNYNDVI